MLDYNNELYLAASYLVHVPCNMMVHVHCKRVRESKRVTYHSFYNFRGGFRVWNILKEGRGHRLQGFCRPLIKPVNSTAVHKRWELSESRSEHFSNRTGKIRSSEKQRILLEQHFDLNQPEYTHRAISWAAEVTMKTYKRPTEPASVLCITPLGMGTVSTAVAIALNSWRQATLGSSKCWHSKFTP